MLQLTNLRQFYSHNNVSHMAKLDKLIVTTYACTNFVSITMFLTLLDFLTATCGHACTSLCNNNFSKLDNIVQPLRTVHANSYN